MRTVPFSDEEVALATKISELGIIWHPKSSDWFIDLNSLRVMYDGSYQQSVSLCLVLDEDGRSFSYLELLIDEEENGNRMKKSTSYEEHDEMNNMIWLPSIKDCIDLINSSEKYIFQSLINQDGLFNVIAKKIDENDILSFKGKTELLAFYNLILDIYKDEQN
jgi:hypothetical protein